MRGLIQEACQGPVRDAVASHGAAVASISEDDLRPIVLRDFQVRLVLFPKQELPLAHSDRQRGMLICPAEWQMLGW